MCFLVRSVETVSIKWAYIKIWPLFFNASDFKHITRKQWPEKQNNDIIQIRASFVYTPDGYSFTNLRAIQ